MSFLAPLGFLFALALPVIILFYLLKLRRVRREVPSTLLWRRAAEDLHANAPFQKLRRNLLLLVQLLIVAALVFALARPFLHSTRGSSRATVIMLDNSASMNATDEQGGRSRLDKARQEAVEFVRGMQPGEQAMLLVFANRPSVAASFTSDKSRLTNAIAAVGAPDLPTRAADAFALAQSLARPLTAELRVYSDGALDAQNIALASTAKCVFVPVGTRANNVGIVRLDLRRALEDRERFQVFASIRNYSDQARTSRLEVYQRDKLVDAKELNLAPKSSASQVFSNAELAPGPVRLALSAADDLASDNEVFGVIAPPATKRILLVTPGNYFLEHALAERAPEIEVTKATPGTIPSGEFDAKIFDNIAPPGPLAPGSYFFINSVPPREGYTLEGTEDSPVLYDWDQQSALMRHVQMADVSIRRAKRIKLPQAARVLAESRETPLMSISESENRRILLWSFDLFESTLPMRAAFPILLSNALDWLLSDVHASEVSTMACGDVIQMEAPPDFKTGVMTDPQGKGWSLTPDAGRRILFDRTDKRGFYIAEINGTPKATFGVSLISETESNIAPAQALEFGNRQVSAVKPDRIYNREIWGWFAIVAILLLALEWLIYHRRWLV